MNIMKIHKIHSVGPNKLEYIYTIEGDWCRFFDTSTSMWVEYSVPVDQVPYSISVLPLIGNVILLASLMDAEIYVEEIDRDFYDCIEKFLHGFDEIMPDHIHFKLHNIIHAKRIVDNPLSKQKHADNLLFFSGGIDATFSLVSHIEEHPALVTIWGADIPWDNEDQWNRAISFNQEVANRHGLELLTIHSNMRKCFNNDILEEYSLALVNDWWWHAFHHSVAMICLAAPLASGNRAKLYFGSTWSSKDRKKWGINPLASAPEIDNFVHFCGCQVIHDGYDFSRYDKTRKICTFYEHEPRKPYLRVCFHSDSGTNCGACEKCVRTVMTLLLEGADPREYGFQYDSNTFPISFAAGIQERARSGKYTFLPYYHDIQSKYRQKYNLDQIPPVLRIFYDAELDILADFLNVPNNEFVRRNQIARQYEDQLYQEIGQLKYELRVRNEQIDHLRQSYESSQEQATHLTIQNNTLQAQLLYSVPAENYHEVLQQKQLLENEIHNIYHSSSWRITAPLRIIGYWLRFFKLKLLS